MGVAIVVTVKKEPSSPKPTHDLDLASAASERAHVESVSVNSFSTPLSEFGECLPSELGCNFSASLSEFGESPPNDLGHSFSASLSEFGESPPNDLGHSFSAPLSEFGESPPSDLGRSFLSPLSEFGEYPPCNLGHQRPPVNTVQHSDTWSSDRKLVPPYLLEAELRAQCGILSMFSMAVNLRLLHLYANGLITEK